VHTVDYSVLNNADSDNTSACQCSNIAVYAMTGGVLYNRTAIILARINAKTEVCTMTSCVLYRTNSANTSTYQCSNTAIHDACLMLHSTDSNNTDNVPPS
jgi:hypothetical protein